MKILIAVIILLMLFICPGVQAATIIYVPMDDRPVNLDYVLKSVKAAGHEIIAPPIGLIAGREHSGDVQQLWQWVLDNSTMSDALVLSSDALLYGGLVPSRTHLLGERVLEERLQRFRELRTKVPGQKIYVLGTVMRTAKMSVGATEPSYYEKFGPKIFRITAIEDKSGNVGISNSEKNELKELLMLVPPEYMKDWRSRRAKNFQINLFLLQWVRDGIIDFLLFGRDDSSPFSASHQEGSHLEIAGKDLGSNHYLSTPGADNLGMSLVVKAINDLSFSLPFVKLFYAPGAGGDTVASYEERPLSETILQHVLATGGLKTDWTDKPDLILAVNTPKSGITAEASGSENITKAKPATKQFVLRVISELDVGRRVAVGDVAFANGADNALMNEFSSKQVLDRLAAYAGWNTAGNTLGYALGQGMLAISTPDPLRKNVLAVRYLDDWAYQANIRSQLINELVYPRGGDGLWLNELKPLLTSEAQKRIRRFAGRHLWPINSEAIDVDFPWNRMFELRVNVR